MAGRISTCNLWDLVPQPEIEPGPLALGAWSLSHWTTRKVPKVLFLIKAIYQMWKRASNVALHKVLDKMSVVDVFDCPS